MFNGTRIVQSSVLVKLRQAVVNYLKLDWNILSFPSVRPHLNTFPLIETTFIKSVHVKTMMNDSLTNNLCAPNACLYLLWSASDGKVMTASARLPDS